jgi:hypothetical protein
MKHIDKAPGEIVKSDARIFIKDIYKVIVDEKTLTLVCAFGM